MGIVLGMLVSLAPQRKTTFVSIVGSAMITGNVACFITACVAGKVGNK